MEYLDTPLKYDSKRQENEINAILYDILKGVYHLHSKKNFHGDLKLENILGTKNTDGEMHYKIIDFDISHLINHQEAVLRKSFIGSYNYVAPEVFFKGDLSFKGDIFSFGAICFFLFHQSIDNSSIQSEIKSKYFKNNIEIGISMKYKIFLNLKMI